MSAPMPQRVSDNSEPIHLWFSLSYANYLVLPRTVLQSMPQEWQQRFVRCLEQLGEATADLDTNVVYDVRCLARAAERVDVECTACEGSGEDGGGNECGHCQGTGGDQDRWETAEEVGFKTDLIPHYNRGRTRVELRDYDQSGAAQGQEDN